MEVQKTKHKSVYVYIMSGKIWDVNEEGLVKMHKNVMVKLIIYTK